MKLSTLSLITAAFVGAVTLSAHETWLVPSTYAGSINQTITFDLTSGMKFPAFEHAIQPDRTSVARCRIGREEIELTDRALLKNSLQFTHAFPRPGLVTAWVTLLPKALELDDAQVVEYLDEISASREIREIWSRLKGRRKWRETYTKCAKTCLAIGPAHDDESWKDPTGMPLEILPLRNPVTLKAGASAEFELRENGRPLPNISLGLITEGSDDRLFQTTDANGRARFTFAKAGRALLFAVDLRPHGEEWESYFATFTLLVAK